MDDNKMTPYPKPPPYSAWPSPERIPESKQFTKRREVFCLFMAYRNCNKSYGCWFTVLLLCWLLHWCCQTVPGMGWGSVEGFCAACFQSQGLSHCLQFLTFAPSVEVWCRGYTGWTPMECTPKNRKSFKRDNSPQNLNDVIIPWTLLIVHICMN